MSTEKKADFSGVSGSVDSTAQQVPKADFSGVSASVDSTAEVVSGGTYTVQKGDSLSKIAKQHLGDAKAVLPEVAKAFLLNIRLFLVAEVFILIVAALVAIIRVVPSPALAPIKLLAMLIELSRTVARLA